MPVKSKRTCRSPAESNFSAYNYHICNAYRATWLFRLVIL